VQHLDRVRHAIGHAEREGEQGIEVGEIIGRAGDEDLVADRLEHAVRRVLEQELGHAGVEEVVREPAVVRPHLEGTIERLELQILVRHECGIGERAQDAFG